MANAAAGNIFGRILGKAVTVTLKLFLGIIVLLLFLLLFMFFKDNLFDPEALLFLGLGVLLLWSNIRRQAETTTAFVFDLLALPLHIVLICGAVSMALLSGLGKFLPDSWEWPVAPRSGVIAFESGRKAVFLDELHRIQVYEADGRYSKGWFLKPSSSSSVFNRLSMYKNEYGIPGEEETVLVHQSLQEDVTVYDLDGRLIGERKREYEHVGFPARQADDFPAVFSAGWYKWPLITELNGVICICIGLIGSIGLDRMQRFFKPGQNNKQDENHE